MFFRLSIARAVVCSALAFASMRASITVAQSTGPTGIATPPASGPNAPLTTNPSPAPLATSSAAATPSASPSPTGRRLAALRVRADRIAFYSNRFIIGADGAVDVTLGDGTRISGNTFAMDLRLNRFVIAGDVTVRAAGQTVSGAAFAEYLDFDRSYFVPITTEPDRWTYAAGDYAHPLLGREMPGDAFFLPDLSGERVFLTAKTATIDPRESVRFTPAALNFGLATVPFPSYFLSFSRNPNFSQNALPDAYVDGPLDFAGGEHGLATLHLRYDNQNKIFPAIEAHQVSNNSYLVFAVNPLTRPLKVYNLLASDRVSPGLQVQFAFQETAFQHAFHQPLSATGFASVQVTGSLRQSYLQFAEQNYYDSFLARPLPAANGGLYYSDPSHPWFGDHATQQQLSWIGYRHPVASLPFTFQLRSSLSAANNTTTPIAGFGGVTYTSLLGESVGLNLATKSIVLATDRARRGRDLYLTGTFDKQRQFSSLPHAVDTQTESVALTKIYDPRHLTVLASYAISNVGDFYGGAQSAAYPASVAVSPVTGEAFPGYRAFRGFSTTHSLVEQVVYTPSNLLTFNLALRQNRSFPQAIPGPALSIGASSSFFNYGAAPYQADFDLRYRLNRLLTVDIARSYYFNFGGYERWSPHFSFALQK